MSALKLTLLVNLHQKKGELVLPIISCLTGITIENALN